MEFNLEQCFDEYREVHSNNRKYKKRLTRLISALYENGRYLEAKYYFAKLELLSNDHPRVIDLGYKLSIALFDVSGVVKYDDALSKSKCKEIDLWSLRLKYFYVTNSKNGIVEYSCLLLSERLDDNTLNMIISFVIDLDEYVVTSKIIDYMRKYKYKYELKQGVVSKFQQTLLQRLLINISGLKNAKLYNCSDT
ncbi:MAG: hypothetical protein KBC57_13770 [Neisseriaceae bacterium]|nr:hypothetical protein [Neisseriaceae bacterium]